MLNLTTLWSLLPTGWTTFSSCTRSWVLLRMNSRIVSALCELHDYLFQGKQYISRNTASLSQKCLFVTTRTCIYSDNREKLKLLTIKMFPIAAASFISFFISRSSSSNEIGDNFIFQPNIFFTLSDSFESIIFLCFLAYLPLTYKIIVA